MPNPALFLFAKQPLAGHVKTRLQPEYTPEQAAEIAQLLIRETVSLALSSWPGAVYLCAAPNAEHPLFRDIARRVPVIEQGEGDLGARMQRALAFGIDRHGSAAVLGCDVPHCPPSVVADAGARLARGDHVLGPALDGGYYFIGLQQAPAELFADIPWGTDAVCGITRERAKALGLDLALLPPLRDIDTPADIKDAARTFEPLRRFLYI